MNLLRTTTIVSFLLPLGAACSAESTADAEDTSSGGASAEAASDGDGSSGDAPAADCVPDEAAFTTNALPVIEAKCARCHGETPDYGAPFSLMEYGPLLDGKPGERIVDLLVPSLAANEMPPPGSDKPDHNEFDTLVGWASCGLEHPDYSEGLWASRPIFVAPSEPPEGTVPVDLTADNHVVGPTVLDNYQYFQFSGVVDEERFIQRIEPIIDESRVVHHSR